MNRAYIESSMIISIGYDHENSVLEIEFKTNGSIWQYFDFPEALWYEFEATDSQGSFWHREIKGQYRESQIS